MSSDRIWTRVDGLKQLEAGLGEFKASTAKGVLRRAGRYALEVFDEAWRRKAPHLTGVLEESGGVGSKLTKRQRQAVERESFVEVFAGPGPNPQAVQQEFGNEHNPPQPFVRPSWDETQHKVLDRAVEALTTEIDKARQRAARKALKLASKG